MAAKSQTDAFNQQLGFLDNTLQPQSQQGYYNFQNQNANVGNILSGLTSPSSVNAANTGFDQGLSTYDQRASDMYNNAGYSPSEIQGQQQAVEQGFAAPYAAAANDAKLQQLRTGNSAGVGSTIQGLARQRGQAISGGLGGLQQGIGQARIQGQQQALSLSQFPQQARLQRLQTEQGTAGLGLTQAGQQQSAYDTGVQGQLGAANLRAGNIASNPSFAKTLGGAVAGGLGSGLAAFGQAGAKSAFS